MGLAGCAGSSEPSGAVQGGPSGVFHVAS
jgi:hypothetical protein